MLAHSRVARDEMKAVLAGYRARVAPGGAPSPSLDRVLDHIAGTAPALPDGSRREPMRWGGVVVLAMVVSIVFSLLGVLVGQGVRARRTRPAARQSGRLPA